MKSAKSHLISLRRLQSSPDPLYVLFARTQSRAAGEKFLKWMQEAPNLQRTAKEVSEFCNALAAGNRGTRLARPNFYSSVLGTLVLMGFMEKNALYDEKLGSAVPAYKIVIQPVTARKPMKGTFLYLAHELALKWNELFASPTERENGAAEKVRSPEYEMVKPQTSHGKLISKKTSASFRYELRPIQYESKTPERK
jgi:hypothetical protein